MEAGGIHSRERKKTLVQHVERDWSHFYSVLQTFGMFLQPPYSPKAFSVSYGRGVRSMPIIRQRKDDEPVSVSSPSNVGIAYLVVLALLF
jgi:hypothetical protein